MKAVTEFSLFSDWRFSPWTGPDPVTTMVKVGIGAFEVVSVVREAVVVVKSVVAVSVVVDSAAVDSAEVRTIVSEVAVVSTIAEESDVSRIGAADVFVKVSATTEDVTE